MEEREVATPHGPARVHLRRGAPGRGGVVLGHGAGGGVGAPDLVTVAGAAHGRGLTVALVEQPYRVAGRRAPAPARQLDAAFTAVVAALREGPLRGLPVVTGGRSSGARVACRTAGACDAAGVLCLAFPLVPPPRRAGAPAPSRLRELEAVAAPVLVAQGDRDPFGMPPRAPGRRVATLRGDHRLRSDLAALAAAVSAWLDEVVPETTADVRGPREPRGAAGGGPRTPAPR